FLSRGDRSASAGIGTCRARALHERNKIGFAAWVRGMKVLLRSRLRIDRANPARRRLGCQPVGNWPSRGSSRWVQQEPRHARLGQRVIEAADMSRPNRVGNETSPRRLCLKRTLVEGKGDDAMLIPE